MGDLLCSWRADSLSFVWLDPGITPCCKKILRILASKFIQSQARMRNADSKIHSSRFDCCAFSILQIRRGDFCNMG